ncbi:MAG: membrane protein insertase YidC [Bryobacteraceae bacterium]
MAEINSGGTSGGTGKPKELSMELRLLLAFILMGVVLFLTPYFYKTVTPPVKKTAPVAAKSEPATVATAATTTPAEPAAPAAGTAPAAPAVAAQKEEIHTIDTDLFQVKFSNRGGTVTSWLLKKYKQHSGAPLQLVNTASHADPPAALYFPAQKPAIDLNQALYEVHSDADGLAISFDYSNGKVVAHKSFQFRKSSYLLDVSTQVADGGNPLPHQIEWRGGFGDMAATNPSGDQQTLRFEGGQRRSHHRDGQLFLCGRRG